MPTARPRARSACADLRAMGADVDVPRAQPLRVRLRADAGDRRRRGTPASPRLIVTVDNGIASVDGVAAAAARGIDVLITDHHLPGATLPAPAIIVNPNQPGCAFPVEAPRRRRRDVLRAVRRCARACASAAHSPAAPSRTSRRCSTSSRSAPSPTSCGSTASTACSSSRASRAFAAAARNRASPRCSPSPAATPRARRASDLGFVAGPRLNAAGRLADMSLGIRCLLADTEREARAARRASSTG